MTERSFAYRAELPPSVFNMAQYCLKAANPAAEKTALAVIHDPNGRNVETWSYRALEEAVLRAAYAFRAAHRLPAGSRAVIRLRITPRIRLPFSARSRARSFPSPFLRTSPNAS